MPSKRIIVAATRFKDAWDLAVTRSVDGMPMVRLDFVELHEAATGLMLATNTKTLSDALAALDNFDPA